MRADLMLRPSLLVAEPRFRDRSQSARRSAAAAALDRARHVLAGALARLSVLVAILVSTSSLPAQSADFKGQDLSGKSFKGKNLTGADFSGAILRSADFSGAVLKGANFHQADLTNAIFTGSDLTEADLRDIVGPFISSQGTNLTKANLEGLDLNRTNFYSANIRGANLKGTSGWGGVAFCSFRAADLRGANLKSMSTANPAGMFVGALYDDATVWPDWVDVAKSGAKKEH
jgi:uncharacterized protein YjbI with pentapeptide repeats